MDPEPMSRRASRHDRRGERPHRARLAALSVAFVVVLGGLVAAGSYYRGCLRPPQGPARTVRFTVRAGATASRVVEDLANQGLIRCGGFVGNLRMRGTGQASRIIAGEYALTTGMTLDQLVTVLTTPPKAVPTTKLTVIPGQRLTEIARNVRSAFGIPTETFLATAQSGAYSLAPYLPAGSRTVEGFLYPETYRFATHGTTTDQVISKLLGQFGTSTADLPWANAAKLGVSDYQIVVIASMIEKEAGTPGDQAKVAAVIYNRLRKDMTLGIDATVAYIDPNPSNGLTDSDFAIDSPYNTRLNAGLPPTPIASPGHGALAAALTPAKDAYLYYVACGSHGGSRFSTTYAKFLRDKAACLG
jgi:UPF0755 protein